MEEQEETIRDIAIKLLENRIKANDASGESSSRSVFILGQKSCGKTSLMNIFLDKNENPKETLGLEYTFGRKNLIGQFGDKNICHIWELGGHMLSTADILSIPLQAHGVQQLAILIMVDLSLAGTLRGALDQAAARLQAALQASKEGRLLKPPVSGEQLFPLPVYVVGGKYDIFSELDPTYKSSVYKILQSFCYVFGAGLFFFSNKEHSLIKRSKEILNYVGLGFGAPIKTSVQDTDKPLQIRPYDWTWAKAPLRWEGAGGAAGDSAPPRDPSLEPAYREPQIDALRAHKDRQLQLLMGTVEKSYF